MMVTAMAPSDRVNMARRDIDEIGALLKRADLLRKRTLETQAEATQLTGRLLRLLDRQAARIGRKTKTPRS